MPRDVAGPRQPYALLVFVREAMRERLAERAQAERLPRNISMQPQREDERLLLGLREHHFELVDDHVAEFARGVAAMQQGGDVVQFERVGYRQQRTRARRHPERL